MEKKVETLIDLRDLLDKFMKKLSAAGELPPSKEIVKKFRAEHKRQIRKVSEKLADHALTQFVSDVSNRLCASDQPLLDADLFREYPKIPQYIMVPVVKDGMETKNRKPTLQASIPELDAWLSEVNHLTRRERFPGLDALCRDVSPFANSPDTTVVQAYKALKDSKGGKTGTTDQ